MKAGTRPKENRAWIPRGYSFQWRKRPEANRDGQRSTEEANRRNAAGVELVVETEPDSTGGTDTARGHATSCGIMPRATDHPRALSPSSSRNRPLRHSRVVEQPLGGNAAHRHVVIPPPRGPASIRCGLAKQWKPGFDAADNPDRQYGYICKFMHR